MSRPLRLEFPGALYHVTARGNGRADIYLDDIDRRAFDELLGEVCQQRNWLFHAACQMSNHYHLLIETPEANLSRGMRQLNGVYTQRFNRRHHRVGHVFQGRYTAILIERETYLLELARYVVLNPVRAGSVRAAKDWRWSSYRATAGLSAPPAWLHRDGLLAAFGRRRDAAVAGYRAFVAEGRGQPSPWEQLRHQIYLGSERFVEALQADRLPDRDLSEIPAGQKRPAPRSLAAYAARAASRDLAIAEAYASGGYSLKDIGAHFGLHYSRISRIVRRESEAKGKT